MPTGPKGQKRPADVVGNAVQSASLAALFGMGFAIDGERWTQTLSAVLATPANRAALIVYGGEPCGMVIEFENGFTVYFAGDTDVFSDMRLIAELHQFDVAFLPIGNYYTMGPKRAAKAVELLGVKTVVPMHFGTFPPLTGRPSQLQELVGGGVTVLDIKPGDEV